jgi:hypothetical protein
MLVASRWLLRARLGARVAGIVFAFGADEVGKGWRCGFFAVGDGFQVHGAKGTEEEIARVSHDGAAARGEACWARRSRRRERNWFKTGSVPVKSGKADPSPRERHGDSG